MFKTALRYGLIAGAILASFSIVSYLISGGEFDFDTGEVVGWTSMLVALSMVYFGIRSYRVQSQPDPVPFTTLLAIGAMISVLATIVWVAGFEIMFAGQMEDFMQKYSEHIAAQMTQDGATAQEIAAHKAEAAEWADLFKNPILRWIMSAGEILPVGLLVSLVAALVESRRKATA